MARHSFIRMYKLPDVCGRVDYISNPKRQEHLYATYETQPREYWRLLAKENRDDFFRSGTEGTCIEAREFIIALPEVYYKEGVFVGYRGFEKAKTAPLFPFGFGLSYTTFSYSNAKMEQKDNAQYEVTVDITNTGSCEGKEIVQLYLGADKPAADLPVKELKDFAKVSLKPGETKTVTLHFTLNDLRHWNEQIHDWQLTPGKYKAYVCASSADIRSTLPLRVTAQ